MPTCLLHLSPPVDKSKFGEKFTKCIFLPKMSFPIKLMVMLVCFDYLKFLMKVTISPQRINSRFSFLNNLCS
jgi:hypothetical protein